MSKPKFKVGDKVTIRSWNDMEKEYGTDFGGNIKVPRLFNKDMKKYCGRVMTISSVRPTFSGEGYTYFLNDAEVWRFSEEMFEESKGKKPLIIIYQDGRNVVALDKITGKKGIARCNPEDKFDFYIGADLAYDRLRERKKPVKPDKVYNGKVCCIFSDCGWFTKGRIYSVVNGVLHDDEGDANCSPFCTFDQLNNYYSSADFIEVIE